MMLCELEPASGSVIAKAILKLPSAIAGSQLFFWASVPYRAMMVALIAGDTTINSSGQPAAESSSKTSPSSYMPAPPPPYSSGMFTPRKPSFPASSHNSAKGS